MRPSTDQSASSRPQLAGVVDAYGTWSCSGPESRISARPQTISHRGGASPCRSGRPCRRFWLCAARIPTVPWTHRTNINARWLTGHQLPSLATRRMLHVLWTKFL
jgi:hypothetical protein